MRKSSKPAMNYKMVPGTKGTGKFMKYLFLLSIFFLLRLPAGFSQDAVQRYQEATASFTFQGQPIHPFLVREFSNLGSDDQPPVITEVDVAAVFDSD